MFLKFTHIRPKEEKRAKTQHKDLNFISSRQVNISYHTNHISYSSVTQSLTVTRIRTVGRRAH